MQNTFLAASDQVVQNITGLALGNGFTLPENTTRNTWADLIRAHVQEPPDLNADQDTNITNFFNSLLQVERIRNEFVRQLKKVLKNPRMYGVPRDWKITQHEALQAIIRDLNTWITRPLIQVPTGVGKSMIWAGIMRAYYDTLRIFGLEHHFEIILFTSRINIADQMVAKKLGTNFVEDEYADDEAIDYGDIIMWFKNLGDEKIRVLAGNSQNKKELEKNAVITLACYPVVRTENMERIFRKKIGLVVADESHRLSDRVRITFENFFYTAFFIGGSATVKGARENNPFKFFEAVQSQKDENGNVVPFEKRLTYWTPIGLCIERKELKKVRYINAITSFDLSSIQTSSKDVLSERRAGQLIAENTSVMKAILESLFLDDYPILQMVGSKTPIERKWLVFTRLISIAEELAQFCNETLVPKIHQKYGRRVIFKADWVSGNLHKNEFNSRMETYEKGITTIMFNAAKLGEGADVPAINGIISFNPYGKYAQWKLDQEIGRGTRYVAGDDLLFIDGVFNSTVHKLASGLTLFGIHNYFPGGLVAGVEGEREVETKVIILLQKGLTYKQAWKKLSKKEQELIPYLEKLAFQSHGSSDEQALLPESTVSKEAIQAVGFIENEQVREQLDRSRLLRMSKENLIKKAKSLLKKYEINSYVTLTTYSSYEFQKLDFKPFGKGGLFLRSFVQTDGEYNVTSNQLKKLAIALGWKHEDAIKDAKKLLNRYGINSYATLVNYPPNKFGNLDFGLFGKGTAFKSFFSIDDSSFDNIRIDDLKKLAIALGWKHEDAIEDAKKLLNGYGINSYVTLVKYPPVKFAKLKFGAFGSGRTLLTFFISTKLRGTSGVDLKKLAIALGWKYEDAIEDAKKLLNGYGINSYATLAMYSPTKFNKLSFNSFGTGLLLRNFFIPDSSGYITRSHLKKLATIFGWKHEDAIEDAKKLLNGYGINSYATLVNYSPNKFSELDFSVFGKGMAFRTFFLPNSSHKLKIKDLKDIAGVLGWKNTINKPQ